MPERDHTKMNKHKALLVYTTRLDSGSLRRSILIKILSWHLSLRKIDGSVDLFIVIFCSKGELLVQRPVSQNRQETLRAHFGCHNSFDIFATPRFSAIKHCNPLGFSYTKSMFKYQLFKLQVDCSLTTGFSGPKSSPDFRETGSRSETININNLNTYLISLIYTSNFSLTSLP